MQIIQGETTITKDRVRDIVKEYQRIFADEFLRFKDAMVDKRANLKFESGILNKDSSNIVERAICEMPETLFDILKRQLTDEQFTWLRTKAGFRWFVTAFPAYSAVKKI